MPFELQKYPEWRQLKQRIAELLKSKSEFSYDELQQLAGGLDIRSARGRAQFYRFRREALKEWQIWLENIPAFGYAVIPAGKQPHAAIKRVKHARRKVALACAINTLAHVEEMTPEQRLLQAQTAALLHNLSQTFNRVGKQFAAAASKLKLDVSEEELKQIGDRTVPKPAAK